MKVVNEEILISRGDLTQDTDCLRAHREIVEAISRVVWPIDSDRFTIYPQKNGNGVVPIKRAFQSYLKEHGWILESRIDVEASMRPGPIDATKAIRDRIYAVEWETGNISSSHRALNKMVLGMLKGILLRGTLVLPTRKLYRYLTDRVGNFEELAPYFDVYRAVECDCGILSVIAVEHDAVSLSVPRIPKGTDGRALI